MDRFGNLAVFYQAQQLVCFGHFVAIKEQSWGWMMP